MSTLTGGLLMLSPLELEKINMLEILLSLVKTPYNEKGNGKGQQNNNCGDGFGHSSTFTLSQID